jgi:hypothetical protein
MFEKKILTDLFFQIIENEGARRLSYQEYTDDIAIGTDMFQVYEGVNGKQVIIYASDEYILPTTAQRLLVLLGLEYLIDRKGDVN